MLLAAGFSTYLARSAEDARAKYLSSWCREAGLGQDFSYARLLSTESTLLKWKAEGLPSDSLSQENALVIAHSGWRVPFVIDPASAASQWLASFLAQDPLRPLELVQVSKEGFLSTRPFFLPPQPS